MTKQGTMVRGQTNVFVREWSIIMEQWNTIIVRVLSQRDSEGCDGLMEHCYRVMEHLDGLEYLCDSTIVHL